MKKAIFFGLLLLMTNVLNSQSLCNVSLKDTTIKMVYAVLSNKIELVGFPYSDQYTATCSMGTTRKVFYEDNRCFFYVNCNPGPNKIDIVVSDSGKEIYRESFKLELFYNPKVSFSNAKDTFITAHQIKKNPSFVIEWGGT